MKPEPAADYERDTRCRELLDDPVFEEPPDDLGGPYQRMLAKVAASPGRWAKIAEYTKKTTAQQTASRVRKNSRATIGGFIFEAVTRELDDGRWGLWIKAVSCEQPDEQQEEPSSDPVALAWVRDLCRSGKAHSLREGANLSLMDIAVPLGVSPSTVLRWETGKRRPRGVPALSYARLLFTLLDDSHEGGSDV